MNDSLPPGFSPHWQQPPFVPSSSTPAPPPFQLFSPPPLFFTPNLPPTPHPQTRYQHPGFSSPIPPPTMQNGFHAAPGQEWQPAGEGLGPAAGPEKASAMGCNLTPWPGYRRVRRSALANPDLTTNVYVRLLPPETRDLDLLHLGVRFGPVLSVRALVNEVSAPGLFDEYGVEVLPAEKKRGGCKGVGFILFAKIEDAEQAILGLNGLGFEASFAMDSVSMKLKRLADSSSTNLYLSNLPPSYVEQDIVNLFSPLHVKSVRLLRESDDRVVDGQRAVGPSRGSVGFARLEDRVATEQAIAKLQNLRLPGSGLPLKIRYADSTEQKELKTQFGRGPAKLPRAFVTPPSSPLFSTFGTSSSPHTSPFPASPTKPPPPFFAPGRISPPTALSSRAEPPFSHPFPHHLQQYQPRPNQLANPFIQHPSAKHFTSSSLLSPTPEIVPHSTNEPIQSLFHLPSTATLPAPTNGASETFHLSPNGTNAAFQPLSSDTSVSFKPLSNGSSEIFRFLDDGGASAFRFPESGGVGEVFRREAVRFPIDGDISVGGREEEEMEVEDELGAMSERWKMRGLEGRKSLP